MLGFVFALAISEKSFWIDEAATALAAKQPTLDAWWRELLHEKGSDLQMPLYMIYIWIWEKIFGHGEWWLRMANLPWLALGLLAVPRRQPAFITVIAVSPFVWFYLNEARPYIMQVGVSLLLLGALWRLAEFPEQRNQPEAGKNLWVWCFGLGLVALSGSSLLGMIWAGAALAAALPVLGRARMLQFIRRHVLLLAVMTLSFLALGLFYLWSLEYGSRATPGSTGIGNILFASYELLGFAGLGPGRAQLHAGDLAVVRPFIPLLAIQAAVTACVLSAGCKRIAQDTLRRVWLGVAAALGTAAIFLLAAGVLKHVRVLDRHFAPLVPALLLLLASGLRELWFRGNFWRALAAFFILLNFGSALELRFAERHVKDDYRTAAAIAIAANARGDRVWWCADEGAGRYYGVPLSPVRTPATPGQVWLASHPLEQLLTNQPPPDLVALSKPDLHDHGKLVRAYLASHQYHLSQTLPVFTLWRKNDS